MSNAESDDEPLEIHDTVDERLPTRRELRHVAVSLGRALRNRTAAWRKSWWAVAPSPVVSIGATVVGYFGSVRKTLGPTDAIDPGRRRVLTYGGLSVVAAAGLSSGDLLYGDDDHEDTDFKFGYGGEQPISVNPSQETGDTEISGSSGRQNADFGEYSQGYGELGYGGVD